MKRFLKILKRTFIILLSIIAIVVITALLYMRKDKFGKLPTGERLEKIKKSPNYKDGKFRNQVELPTISKGYSMMGELSKTIFGKSERIAPVDSLPSVKTDLLSLPLDSNLVVWFGHSSLYMQLDGKRILIDPVFSGSASPIPGSVKAYKGTDVYKPADMPEIDYLFISHDHYDHLDYETVLALKNKVKYVVCGLGTGAHFEYWGYTKDQILERDWYEDVKVDSNYTIHILPTHHDAGRGFTRAQSLWVAFLIESPTMKVFYSGDGGYDPMFKEIGDKYGVVDLAIMECGQYNKAWQSVHKLPDEVKQATIDIHAKRLLPVHHSKFTLARHPWDEPLKEMTAMAKDAPYTLATPMIGEIVYLNKPEQTFTQWWLGLN